MRRLQKSDKRGMEVTDRFSRRAWGRSRGGVCDEPKERLHRRLRDVGSGIKGVGSGIRRVGTAITAPGSRITSHGIGISSFLRDQAVPFLWDQGPKFVTLLESRIRNLGAKMGSAMKKKPCYSPERGHRGVSR